MLRSSRHVDVLEYFAAIEVGKHLCFAMASVLVVGDLV
jgi:hypothetical protein